MRFELVLTQLVAIPLLLCGCDPDQDGGPELEEEAPPMTNSEIRTSGGPTLSAPPLLSQHALQLPESGYEQRSGLEALNWDIAEFANPGQAFHVKLNNPVAGQAASVRLAVELFGGPAYATSIRCEGAWALRVDGKAETVLVIYNATPAAMQASLA